MAVEKTIARDGRSRSGRRTGKRYENGKKTKNEEREREQGYKNMKNHKKKNKTARPG